MKLRDSFYQSNSSGHYLFWSNDDGTPSHFGWEAPSDPNYDKKDHSYCVWFKKDFKSDNDMILAWETKKKMA